MSLDSEYSRASSSFDLPGDGLSAALVLDDALAIKDLILPQLPPLTPQASKSCF
jgi:hypothetical protein